MRRTWPWLALPLTVGGGAALAALARTPVPILYLRIDLATLALLAGVAAAAALGAALAARRRMARARQQAAIDAALRAADDRRRFLGRLDHELKNPLTAIRLGLTNLAEAPPVARDDALASIGAQTLRLSRLSADLRKLAELETRPLERGPVDLDDVLQEVVSLAGERPEAAGRTLTLTVQHAPWPLPPVAGDRDLLFLALHNLLDNALKFTRTGDTIELRAFEDERSIMLEVADTGPGVDDADLPHVFEELYRGQAARETPGSGLGLALVRAIVARHGGGVTLRSRRGRGTVVTIRLPPADVSKR
jgi:two-component system OmpR family sensor kinase